MTRFVKICIVYTNIEIQILNSLYLKNVSTYVQFSTNLVTYDSSEYQFFNE